MIMQETDKMYRLGFHSLKCQDCEKSIRVGTVGSKLVQQLPGAEKSKPTSCPSRPPTTKQYLFPSVHFQKDIDKEIDKVSVATN